MPKEFNFTYPWTLSKFGSWNQSNKPIYFVNIYAVSTVGGSEPGIGFAWLKELLKHFRIILYTESEFKPQLVRWLKSQEHIACMIYFINVGDKARSRCWNQGNWAFYLDYWRYQITVYKLASIQIKLTRPIFLHHLNMIGFREPGYFWLLSILHAVPLIWGPIGGYNFPAPYLYKFYGFKIVFHQAIKNLLNFFSFLLPSVSFSFFRAELILLSIPLNKNHIIFKIRNAVIFPETFLTSSHKFSYNKVRISLHKDSFSLIIIGKLVPRKLVDIAIESIAQLPREILKKVNLRVIGDGPCRQALEKLVTQKSLNHQVTFYGKLSHNDCMSLLNSSDLLIHTSVDEGLPSAVTEALAFKKMVLAFNSSGLSLLEDHYGIKLMPYPKSRGEAVLTLSNKILFAFTNKDLMKDEFLSRNKLLVSEWSPRNRLLFFISLIKKIT